MVLPLAEKHKLRCGSLFLKDSVFITNKDSARSKIRVKTIPFLFKTPEYLDRDEKASVIWRY